MRYLSLFLLFYFTCITSLFAQKPKREFRAAWIATVANIDWPSKPGMPSIAQQEEFIKRLDQLKALGCNAVIVQVRPAADALYTSQIEPWSRYLTGRQGTPPFPYYDPLLFMIEETHKRNMEFHAWFNPFRALMDSHKNMNPMSHVTRQHPEWIINYDGKSYFDAGQPEVRDYVIQVIMDVVKRYDIDAVHIDDYFYPYRVAGLEYGDRRSFSKYGQSFSNKDDWRRNNVDLFISALNKDIKKTKPYVKLGISPFGVWRNINKDTTGSATHAGQTSYDDLYADVVLWMQKGWIDYLLPQLYWEHNNHAAAFDVLLQWWETKRFGRHIYYGLGVYRMSEQGKHWTGPREILSQIKDIRETGTPSGFSFYSTSSFDKIGNALRDSLRYNYNATIALPPAMKWLDSIPPAAPVLTAIPSYDGTLLQWQENKRSEKPAHYVVYRFINDEPINLDKAEKILAVVNKDEFLDAAANRYKKCTYIITATDRLWNESKPSNMASTTNK